MTTTLTPAVNKAAHIHSPAVTARCDNLALMGSAKSTENISSACTSKTDPPARAAACNPMLAANSTVPHHHRWLRSRLANSSTEPTALSVMQCAARCCRTSPTATHNAELSASRAAISVRPMGITPTHPGSAPRYRSKALPHNTCRVTRAPSWPWWATV